MIESQAVSCLAFISPGWPELVILALLGVLIFGKRLPEVGKSIGKGIVEFKKGISGIDAEVEEASNKSAAKEKEASEPQQLEEPGEEIDAYDERAQADARREPDQAGPGQAQQASG